MTSLEKTGNKIVGAQEGAPDELVPDPVICKEFGITPMTLWRWDRDPSLDFPPPVRIRKRKFRSRRGIEAFKSLMVSRGIAKLAA